ncbi:MAG: Holliday junction resolvase RuvX [bacterium]|nr:Holliday junction resolvase RuvX [bacterium]MCP5070109.1 Holliday junction resolvase RuvX [bacterium]
MPVLGIDFGSRRLGLAVSDLDDRIALPLEPIASRGAEQDLAVISDLVRSRGVSRIVVGLPIHLDGSRGAQAEAADRFAAGLREALALPVDLLDERLTTREALNALEDTGRRGRRKKKAVVDSVAATVLLRTYLEQRAARRASGGAA